MKGEAHAQEFPKDCVEAHLCRLSQCSDPLDRELYRVLRWLADCRFTQSESARLSELIPTSWLDPLLTGPEAVIRGHNFDCQDIERLLSALKKRIQEAEGG